MKTLITLLAAGLLPLAAHHAHAQDALGNPVGMRPHPLLINLKGGLNLSTYTGGGYIGWDTGLKTGFSAGLSGTQRLTARTAWQVELVYSGKGAQQRNYWHQYYGAVPPT